jgi:hypothetical protein
LVASRRRHEDLVPARFGHVRLGFALFAALFNSKADVAWLEPLLVALGPLVIQAVALTAATITGMRQLALAVRLSHRQSLCCERRRALVGRGIL